MNPAEGRQQVAPARATGLRAREVAESLGLSERSALAAHVAEHEAPQQSHVMRLDQALFGALLGHAQKTLSL